MITWFQLFPAYLLSIIPWIIAAIPNNAGGYFRQFLANSFLNLLPNYSAQNYARTFLNADVIGEYLAILPALIITTILIVWIVFLIGTATITINNRFAKGAQKSVLTAQSRG